MSRGESIGPDIRQQIIDAYQGVEELDTGAAHPRKQRVFLWEDGPRIMMGNAPAFAEFLGVSWSTVHKVLRDAGHQLWNAPRVERGEIVNEFVDPLPFAEQIGVVEKAGPTVKELVKELLSVDAKIGVKEEERVAILEQYNAKIGALRAEKRRILEAIKEIV